MLGFKGVSGANKVHVPCSSEGNVLGQGKALDYFFFFPFFVCVCVNQHGWLEGKLYCMTCTDVGKF